MYQQITIVGNVGRDPEMRYTQSGVPVCDFSVAVNKVWNNSQGERQEKTTWFRVTCWRGLAETVNQYLRKGRQVFVVGEIDASAYLNNAGQPAASLDLTATTVKFIGSRDDDFSGSTARREYDDDFAPPPGQVDDIPF